ncbi:uncharacterized protein LOC134264828 [Saccostrea cucullata]|uniref:uncharacterized protein LOC134264828 n=1 Tax=Saccostrea cuccullata TaxID=36930 RepID=UPI002ED2488B
MSRVSSIPMALQGDGNTFNDDVSTLSDDEVAVLYCFLCSDSGPPDFTDKEWLDILNEILRIVSDKKDPVTSEEAHIVLNGLESRDFVWEDQNKITEDVKDEIMFKLALIDPSLPFYYSSYETSRKYLRSEGYRRKPREKCVVCGIDMLSNYIDYLLISRLQMNTLTHVTIEDGDILDGLYWILNVPKAISRQKQSKRKQFLRNLEHKGESAHCSGRSGDSVPHVKWLWNQRRPDIVRSCIGLYPHWDVYIINNKAYKKPSKYHKLDSDVRSLLYCLLFLDECMMNVNEDNYKPTLNKIREIYFKAGPFCNDISTIDLPKEIMKRTENKLMFSSKNIQHNVTG